MKIEKHAYETYVKYSAYHPEDKKIAEIADSRWTNELKHARRITSCNVNDLMVVWSIVWMILILVISVAVVIYYIMRYDHFFPND